MTPNPPQVPRWIIMAFSTFNWVAYILIFYKSKWTKKKKKRFYQYFKKAFKPLSSTEASLIHEGECSRTVAPFHAYHKNKTLGKYISCRRCHYWTHSPLLLNIIKYIYILRVFVLHSRRLQDQLCTSHTYNEICHKYKKNGCIWCSKCRLLFFFFLFSVLFFFSQKIIYCWCCYAYLSDFPIGTRSAPKGNSTSRAFKVFLATFRILEALPPIKTYFFGKS